MRKHRKNIDKAYKEIIYREKLNYNQISELFCFVFLVCFYFVYTYQYTVSHNMLSLCLLLLRVLAYNFDSKIFNIKVTRFPVLKNPKRKSSKNQEIIQARHIFFIIDVISIMQRYLWYARLSFYYRIFFNCFSRFFVFIHVLKTIFFVVIMIRF